MLVWRHTQCTVTILLFDLSVYHRSLIRDSPPLTGALITPLKVTYLHPVEAVTLLSHYNGTIITLSSHPDGSIKSLGCHFYGHFHIGSTDYLRGS